MPVLRTSASDFTAWSRANAILPANGKAAKSTDTTVDRKAAAVVAIGSQSAIGATPSSAIAKRWRIVPAVPAVKITPLANLTGTFDSFIAKYNSAGKVQWVAKQGGTSNDWAEGVTADSSGNVIVAGQFSSATLSLYNYGGGLAATLTLTGNIDGFIAKYDSAGILQWAAKQGGTNADRTYDAAVDSSGNILVVGHFGSSSMNFYNANGTPFGTTFASAGSFDSFIAKYNSAGTVQWVAQHSGAADETPSGVTVDSSGNVIVAGYFNSTTTTFYHASGTPFGTLTNSGGNDSFIAKYDSAGTVQWVAQQSGIYADYAYAVTVDSSGNVIITGYSISPTVTLYNSGGGASTTLTNSAHDSFIAKYNSAGIVQWGALQSTTSVWGTGVTADSAGNVIVAGYFNSTPLTVYNTNGTPFGTTLSNPTGNREIFVAKYNSAGTVQWATRIGGTDNESAVVLTVDSSGNVIVAGYFYSTTLTLYNANGTVGTTLTRTDVSNISDSFIAKYDSAGTLLWAALQAGGTANDEIYGVTVDSSGNIIVGGLFGSIALTCYNSDGTDILIPEIPPSIAYYR